MTRAQRPSQSTRLYLSNLSLDVNLESQLATGVEPPATLHVLGFLPADQLGCPPVTCMYTLQPLASTGSSEPAPLYVTLLSYLTGNSSGPLVAAVRTDLGRAGFLAAERAVTSEDAVVHRLVFSVLHFKINTATNACQ
ncbi:hypothetical protein WJX72_007618 [[Myrmecia] bisecta]|uniref:Uncharacterized protein n=1 Tax=[Myrmecia] bisecta TaxID=41462 RepID=A0AAW1Q4P5_9CHLO